jgi:hypothetical protein
VAAVHGAKSFTTGRKSWVCSFAERRVLFHLQTASVFLRQKLHGIAFEARVRAALAAAEPLPRGEQRVCKPQAGSQGPGK